MRILLLASVMGTGCLGIAGQAAEPVRIAIDPGTVERTIDLGRLTGGNVALWYEPATLASESLARHMDQWKPGILRMPGGSWSDEYFWNGNGVRTGDRFDRSKLRDGRWQPDYSGYAPGFRLLKSDGTLSDFHGNTDVKALHEFIRKQGAEAIITVNAGTGTPEMAAEWVRWANKKQGYAAKYWEVGNELDGEWELGHFGRDGQPVNAEEYARRFLAFAKAMKAVDPSIKVGGPACSNDQLKFVETLIREAGPQLDFVSFHTYPVQGGSRTDAARFAQADDVARAVGRIRGWVAAYHPQRTGLIEIGVTEWHKQVMETRETVDLASGLWACLFIGALAESGVDFANQWDCFSSTGRGGHGLFGKPGKASPRAAFHAMMLWREHMHSGWLAVRGGDATLRAFATRNDKELAVMLVNTSKENFGKIALQIGGEAARGRAKAYRFSHREYFWNPHEHVPEWSKPAVERRVRFGEGGVFEIPPFCSVVLKMPLDGEANEEALPVELGQAELAILLPETAPADQPVEGFVVVRRAGTKQPFQGDMERVNLSVRGGGEIDRGGMLLVNSVGRFVLHSGGARQTSVRATTANAIAEQQIKWTTVTEREQVCWTFPDDDSVQGMESTYWLRTDRQARPNQSVAVVRLDKAKAEPQKNTLLAITQLPGSLPKEHVGGVCGLLGASGDLRCDDPAASVEVVLQSNHDHWILLKRVPLGELRGTWKDLEIRLTKPTHLEAMAELYAIRLHLKSKSPVTGRLYVDDLGFIIRGKQSP